MDHETKDSKVLKQLLEAKDHFLSWRLLEAYTIFRRYFDRIPFRPERGHAEYIGMFVRTLAELGKEHELKFYMNELERHYETSPEASIAFTLGVVYYHLSDPRMEAARKLFERVIADPSAAELHPKAKMFLANYYDRVKGDVAKCREIIDSIGPVTDPSLRPLVEIWKAKVLRDEDRNREAEAAYLAVLGDLDSRRDWYPYFSAKVGLAILYLKTGEAERASDIVAEVKKLFEGRHFKSIQIQLKSLESKLGEKEGLGVLYVATGAGNVDVTYDKRTLSLKADSPSEKLLLLLVKRKFLDKANIVKSLYDRHYSGEQDDKLIYYHIHMLRKRLKEIGLPNDAIESRDSGYRLVPVVETLESLGKEAGE